MAYFDSLLQKCTSFAHIKQLQSLFITSGFFQFSSSRSKLLDLCAVSASGDLSYAVLIFRQIQNPLTNDWNAVLRGLAESPEPKQALLWYKAMCMSPGHCRVDALSCSFSLKACARTLARVEATQIHSQIVRHGFDSDVLLQTTLLDVYAKVGELDFAQKVFDEMDRKDAATWNALICGLAQGSRPFEAIDLFKRMREVEGLKPNEVSVIGALSACSQLGAFREGERIHLWIKDEKLDLNVTVCNVLIDMHAKCGHIERAYSVFDTMKCRKSRVTWNTMMMAFAMHGDGYKACELFEQMGKYGISPDAISYLAMLCAYNHAGLVDEGVTLFNSMEGAGVAPNVKHYGTMVDLLGRAGRLKEAYEMIDSMPLCPDIVLWQTLLGACKTHGNVEMAETASQKLVDMGSNSCGDFVLLSNIYASHKRWDDVGKVRGAMKKRDVKKIPGFSYIEVEGIIHKFVYGDHSHVRSGEIYAKLEEIKLRIKSYGYVAGIDNVLHDIGEEDKENVLCYHSEKLAVAFGLISTAEGRSIQVIKNLRICGDCHAMIKLISKIYERDIMVRDRTRFHRFKEGFCSCKDYW